VAHFDILLAVSLHSREVHTYTGFIATLKGLYCPLITTCGMLEDELCNFLQPEISVFSYISSVRVVEYASWVAKEACFAIENQESIESDPGNQQPDGRPSCYIQQRHKGLQR